MVMRGPKVRRSIKIGATQIEIVAWWEKRGNKVGRTRLSVACDGKSQTIVADYSDYPIERRNQFPGVLSKVAFAIAADEQARRVADSFVRRLGLTLQNALAELYRDFISRDASFYLDPKDSITVSCWFSGLQRAAQWAGLLEAARDIISRELLKKVGWSGLLEKEREAGRRLVAVASSRSDERDYLVDLNFDLGLDENAA
jgi:hypothetical protein